MKSVIWLCLFLFFSSSWGACSACMSTCENQFSTCSEICKDSCAQCGREASMTSHRAYARFVHDQTVQGGIISRELQSYRDPLQCDKKTCSCVAEFALCKEACSGTIKKFVMPAPRCC